MCGPLLRLSQASQSLRLASAQPLVQRWSKDVTVAMGQAGIAGVENYLDSLIPGLLFVIPNIILVEMMSADHTPKSTNYRTDVNRAPSMTS